MYIYVFLHILLLLFKAFIHEKGQIKILIGMSIIPSSKHMMNEESKTLSRK